MDVEPLSFFMADGRTKRDPDRRFVFTDRGMQQLDHWVEQTIAGRRVGIFATGQSLLSARAGGFAGRVGDYEMPNYGDFGRVAQALARIPAAGLPLLLITGDVHWGRVARALDSSTGAAIYEVISSPSSLVSTVGVDEAKRAWNFFKRDDWPRHADAEPVPDFVWPGSFGKRFACSRIHPQKGNHVALLSFSRSGSGVSMRATYYPIAERGAIRNPVALDPIMLRAV
jgi:hypothetical protein